MSVTKDTANVSLLMTRITSNLTVNASGVAAGEAVVATSGGVSQALNNLGDGTATGTLSGVATGGQVFVVVEAKNSSGAVVKQGQSAVIALSETDKTVSVALTAVGSGNQVPDSVALSVAPSAPVAGSPVTLSIAATDPDGSSDLTSALINWMDGSDLQTQALTNGAASPTHTYAVAGSYTVSVTVYDQAGASKSASTTVTVAPQETGSDVGVDVDTDDTLVTMTVKATNVATNATTVVTKIAKVVPGVTTTDLQASYTISLYKVTGGEWQASLELTENTEYSLQLFVDDAAAGSPVTFTPSATAKTVSVSGGATRTNTNPVATNDGTPTNPKIVFVNEVKVLNVLANDTDADGDSLVIVSATAPQQNGAVNGTVTIAADGKTLTYKGPTASTNELTTFNYTVSDGHGGTATATVYVFVQSGGSF